MEWTGTSRRRTPESSSSPQSYPLRSTQRTAYRSGTNSATLLTQFVQRTTKPQWSVAVLDDLVMQAVGTYDGDFTLHGTFLDYQPGVNPSYTFEWFDKETRTATLTPADYSQVAMKAIEDITVLTP